MGALVLDALFGGHKALGAMPGFDDLCRSSLKFLRKRLERANRSSRNHFWRGLFSLILLGAPAVGLGFLLNTAVFWHVATATFAAAVLAQILGTKIAWQSTELLAKGKDSADRRQAIENLFNAYAKSIVPSLVLFLLGGFALLFAYRLVLVASNFAAASTKTSSFLKPFVFLQRLLGAPGEFLATVFVFFATIFVPQAYVLQSVKTFLQTKSRVRHGTLAVVAGAFNIALQPPDFVVSKTWLGPKNGSAKIEPEACRYALIVALVAFAVLLAFLLVLLVAGFK